MVRSVDPDHDEAEHQREIGRPDAQQGGQQMDGLPARRMRNLDLQDEQRDRDGKDAVAERLDPPGIPLRAGAPGFAYGLTASPLRLRRSAVLPAARFAPRRCPPGPKIQSSPPMQQRATTAAN